MHSRWISDLVREHGHRVIVANARQVQLIHKRKWKTDRSDALLLARLGRFDPTLLAPVHHRSKSAQLDLVCLRARHMLESARTDLINHVRDILKPFGLRVPDCGSQPLHGSLKQRFLQSSCLLLGLSSRPCALSKHNSPTISSLRHSRRSRARRQGPPQRNRHSGGGASSRGLPRRADEEHPDRPTNAGAIPDVRMFSLEERGFTTLQYSPRLPNAPALPATLCTRRATPYVYYTARN